MAIEVTDKVEISLGDFPCGGEPFMAVVATDRQAMVDFLDECVGLQNKRGLEICGFTITMPCGSERRFTNHCDIPFEDLPCPCGQGGHYLIRYKKE